MLDAFRQVIHYNNLISEFLEKQNTLYRSWENNMCTAGIY